jgi:hypothetical protein
MRQWRADREKQMRFEDRGLLVLAAYCAVAFILSLALTIRTAGAQDKTSMIKIGTPTVNNTSEEVDRGSVQMVEKDSGGGKPELYRAYKLVTEAAKRTRQGPTQ